MEISTRFQHPLELGVIAATCPSTHWLVIGTSSGTISLWDLRFGLLLKSWRASGPVTSIQIHPSKGRNRWIMGATKRSKEGPLVEVYDIESGRLVEVYEVRMTRPTSKNPPPPEAPDVPLSRQDYIAEIVRQNNLTAEEIEEGLENATPSVMSLIVGSSFASLSNKDDEGGGTLLSVPETKAVGGGNPGWMITAGEDRVVRYWDLVKVGEGFVICGSPKEKDVTFKYIDLISPTRAKLTHRQSSTATPTLIYTIPNNHRQSDGRHVGLASARQPLRPHYDVVAALGTVETPFSSCVVSADRSGVVKVWRLEGGK